MLQTVVPRSRTLKLILLVVIFFLLSALFMSDSIVAKIYPRRFSESCTICPFNDKISFGNSSEIIHFSTPASRFSKRNAVNVVSFFAHSNRNPGLKSKFTLCLTSLFKHATPSLHLHILTDDLSLNTAVEILQKTVPLANTSIEVIKFIYSSKREIIVQKLEVY